MNIISSKIRVIVPARNADHVLPRCIEAIRSSRMMQQSEIIVVDDSVTPSSFDALVSYHQIELRRGKVQGSSAAARNLGAVDFKHGILVFVDADVVVDPETLPLLLQPILEGKTDATLGNYSSEVSGLSFLQRYKQLYISTIYKRSAGTIKNEFWSAIGAVRAEVFHACEGFNPSFTGAGGEDTDFGMRLSEQAFNILAVPAATGQHLHAYTFLGLIRNDFAKGMRSMELCLNKHTSLTYNRHSSRRDIFAVLCAVLISTFVIVALTTNAYQTLVVLAVLVLLYLGARADLFLVYYTQGKLFLIASVFLAFILDCVRAACAVSGILRWYMQSEIKTSRLDFNHTTQ